MTREYYEINEDAARQAKAMWSHSDYVMGSKTEEYKRLLTRHMIWWIRSKNKDHDLRKKQSILQRSMQRSWQKTITTDSESK